MAENIVLTEAVYYILLSLKTPMHGYGIMQNVAKLTEGRISLAAGTLYGAITTMVKKGLIGELPGEKNSRKKEYVITEDGKRAVRNEMVRLEELLKNGKLTYGSEQI